MKKTILLALSILGATYFSNAQTVAKRFEVSYEPTGTYSQLSSSATEVSLPVDWDDEISAPIPMPFPFKYQNVPVTSVEIETYGSLYLNGIQDIDPGYINGINMDYESKNRGKVYYETTGTTGNRIFKVEYRNVGRYNDTTSNDTLNFQIWLYEANNNIEYRAGYSNVPASEFASSVADLMADKEFLIAALFNNNGNNLSIIEDSLAVHSTKFNGTSLSDTILDANYYINSSTGAELENMLLGHYPPMGSVIKFMALDTVPTNDTTTSIKGLEKSITSIYPNPSSNGKFEVELDKIFSNAIINVYDLTGKQVSTQTVTGQSFQIDLSQQAAGQYWGELNANGKKGYFKLMKK